ncbi:ATP-binding protein [Oryzifoliimicrobium ureilyticus]|uniref:ATP-binding protein n=1 Tax=Oryzifoliimicrobium ureilyticus TaxID=3113724 RepID=UPI00307657F0
MWSRRSLFQRLLIAMSAVAIIEICVSAAYLYVRFEGANNQFREETLTTFADELIRDLHSDPQMKGGASAALIARIKSLHGQYALLNDRGEVLNALSSEDGPLFPLSFKVSSFFLLPAGRAKGVRLGLSRSTEIDGRSYVVQIAFPRQDVVFDTFLEEFVDDIAWLWIPFVALLLISNAIVLAVALKPLRSVSAEVAKIDPSSIASRLTERELPGEILTLVKSVNGALDRLETGFRALDEFAGHLAHELRTPMAIAKARVSILPDETARIVESDFAEMERVVTQIIDRVRIGSIHFEPTDLVDLGQIAARSARFLAPVIIGSGKSVALEAIDKTIRVNGAEDFVFRALRNLIENALRHSPPGGLITISVFEFGIAVSDEGQGFPPSQFETGLHKSVKVGGSEGLGLGLKIVSETMNAHGGSLRLENRSEGGARATMLFSPAV